MQNSKKEHLLMYRIFETETFLKSLEQDFGGQRKKITDHAYRTWFDEDPSKGSENIDVQSF